MSNEAASGQVAFCAACNREQLFKADITGTFHCMGCAARPTMPVVKKNRRLDEMIFWLIVAALGLGGLGWCASRGGSDKSTSTAVAPPVSAYHLNDTPTTPGPSVDDGPTFEFVNDAPAEEGKRVARAIIAACRTRVTGRMADAWGAVRRVTVEHHEILDHGKRPMIWDISYKFAPATTKEVLDGNVLWYLVSDDLVRINPTKDIAGDMCGGLPGDRFSDFIRDPVFP